MYFACISGYTDITAFSDNEEKAKKLAVAAKKKLCKNDLPSNEWNWDRVSSYYGGWTGKVKEGLVLEDGMRNEVRVTVRESANEVDAIVNKILEGCDISASLMETATGNMMIKDFVKLLDRVRWYIVGTNSFWYDLLLEYSPEIKKDFDETFKSEHVDAEKWFKNHWGVTLTPIIPGTDLAGAPNCMKAGIRATNLQDYAKDHRKIHSATQVAEDPLRLYIVGK